MALLTILEYPDPRLRTRARPVERVTPELRQLAADMLETMYAAPGIGLAATQVDVHVRLLVMDVSEEKNSPLVLINPEIVWSSEEKRVYDEGCLSIPDYYAEVERPDRVRVKFRDLDGTEREIEADGLLSTCIQHEIDHLNGVLFIDHLSKLKRDRVIKKFTKAAKRDAA